MKKLDYNHLTTGTLTVDASHLIGVVNDLIDLVNSQQEAIEKLEKRLSFFEVYGNPSSPPLEPADDKPHPSTVIPLPTDTHRTVTLRIPKGLTLVEALFYADLSLNMSDNQAKKALDEVQPNE